MLGVVGEIRRAPSAISAIFASGSVLLVQSSVRDLLTFALAIEPDQAVDRRRFDAALLVIRVTRCGGSHPYRDARSPAAPRWLPTSTQHAVKPKWLANTFDLIQSS